MSKKNYSCVPSGFKKLDEITGGFQKSDLIVVASRPGMGKTSFALNIAFRAAEKDNKNVLFFTQEMNRETVINRFLSLNKEQDRQVVENLRFIDYLYNAMDIMDESQRQKAENNIDLIIIDCLQLINLFDYADKHQKYKYLPQYLKQLAKAIGCPVIVLSQLSRALDERECKRPRFSDFDSANTITNYADLILLLYRDDYYNLDSEFKGICEIIVAKNRHGATGTARLKWIEERGLFCDIEEEQEGFHV